MYYICYEFVLSSKLLFQFYKIMLHNSPVSILWLLLYIFKRIDKVLVKFRWQILIALQVLTGKFLPLLLVNVLQIERFEATPNEDLYSI